MRIFILFASVSLLSSASVAQTNAPPDKPDTMRGKSQTDAYIRAIAPYVAKARASYPAAKKRFLAGLPPHYTFAVWVRLYQRDEKTREQRYEDVFVGVKAIKSGTVYGWINSKPVAITTHRQGEQIQFPESEVMNWLIVHPDGTEEGNVVGKFLDHWKPPKA
jgi:uncharacterized protein YegJ (DUF2314 family)